MPSKFDVVRRCWPERGIFQGAATAYARFSQQPQRQWIYLEKPLWQYVLSFFPRTTRMLDFGAGIGKLTWVALSTHQIPRRITCFEPNPILQNELQKSLPPVRAVRRSNRTLSQSFWANDKFSLIGANMVINHLNAGQFDEFVTQSKRMLTNTGTLIFTIPHPVSEAHELNIPLDVDETRRETPAPWGGFTEYFHRSPSRLVSAFRENGFHVGLIEWGYEDVLHGFQIEPIEERVGHPLRDPKRLMVIARKGRPIPERMLIPPSIRPTTLPAYTLQERFGETPGISKRIQDACLHESSQRFY